MNKMNEINIDKILKILKSVADNYPKSSEEYKSIEIATKAIIELSHERTLKKLNDLLKDNNLTDEQKKHLRKLGLIEDL